MAKPPKYTQKEFNNLLAEFWDKCAGIGIHPTKQQLIVHLDITRQTYNRWKDDDRYSDALKKAENMIEAHLVNHLLEGKNVAGTIFYLKNAFGYRDKKLKSCFVFYGFFFQHK